MGLGELTVHPPLAFAGPGPDFTHGDGGEYVRRGAVQRSTP
jgi:hypothetical protein